MKHDYVFILKNIQYADRIAQCSTLCSIKTAGVKS